MQPTVGREKEAQKVTLLGMLVNFILVVFKFLAGILGGSAALVADAIHSLSDFISDIIVIIGFKFTSKPADEDHNYGHGKVETVSTVIIGLLLVIISVALFRSSGTTIYKFFFEGEKILVPKFYVLFAVLASIILKEIIFHITKAVGKKINSEVIIANAWHHRTDALSSVAAFIGIVLAISFGEDFAVCDPIASFVVSIFIFKVGFGILLSSYKQLIDTSLTVDEVKKIEETIKSIPQIKDYHNIKTRRIGYYVSIDVHILVDKDLNVEQAHDIATTLEDKVHDEFGQETFISVHIEPFIEKYILNK
ncbi:cation transporter [Mycoplasmatota bacterium]|nr:cation transporter [Mycoplasmatota bacterium]